MLGETILAIDTDNETLQKIVAILEAEDFLVFTASSGDVGITMAKKVNPSVIFINPAMSGSSGLEICKSIHNTAPLKSVPIVVLSAFEGAADPRYTTVYGIVGSLKKPFSKEELVAKTKDILSLKSAPVEPAEEAIEPGEMEEEIPTEMEEEKLKAHEEETAVTHESIKSEPGMEKEKESALPDETVESHVLEDEEDARPVLSAKSEPEGTAKTYTLKKPMRRQSMKSSLVLPIVIVLCIFILAGAGFVLYDKGMLPWIGKKTQKPVAVKPSESAGQQTAQVPPVQEQPAPAAKTTPPPAPAAKPAVKPSGKAVYSVQIGAFKSESNAAALTKQLKDKGYDAFTVRNVKDKEPIYRVLVGKYENKKDASKTADSLRSKENTKAIVVQD